MSVDKRDIEYLKKYLPHDKLEDGLRLLEEDPENKELLFVLNDNIVQANKIYSVLDM